jgi:methionine-rich copper-binding protein CopC
MQNETEQTMLRNALIFGLSWIKPAALSVALWIWAIATPAFGHAHLSKAIPAAGASVPAPNEINLTFTEPLEPAFSGIELRDASGKTVKTDKVQVKDNVMRLPLKSLPAGRYTVKWRVLSVDTHKSEGNFTFTVQP